MMRRALLLSWWALLAACGNLESPREGSSNLHTLKQELALFDYVALSDTNNGTDPNTSTNKSITLQAGEAVMIGTCNLTGARYTGETVLNLYAPNGTWASGSNHACDADGSKISYTPSVSGAFLLRAGCFIDTTCSGTVAISRRRGAPVPFSASNTNNALINTYNKQYHFDGGDVVRVSTCGYNATGATASGDTYLRLYQNNGGVFTQVAASDSADTPYHDFCETEAEIVYTVPTAGYYQVRIGCAANKACSGNLAVYVE